MKKDKNVVKIIETRKNLTTTNDKNTANLELAR